MKKDNKINNIVKKISNYLAENLQIKKEHSLTLIEIKKPSLNGYHNIHIIIPKNFNIKLLEKHLNSINENIFFHIELMNTSDVAKHIATSTKKSIQNIEKPIKQTQITEKPEEPIIFPDNLQQTNQQTTNQPTTNNKPNKARSILQPPIDRTIECPNDFSAQWNGGETDNDLELFRNDMLNVTNKIRKLWWTTSNAHLELDESLNNKAQAWAEYIARKNVMQHGTYQDDLQTIVPYNKMNHGQNIAMQGCSGTGCPDFLGTAKFAVRGWLVECNNCKKGVTSRCTERRPKKNVQDDNQVGHFTQLIWRDARLLGVGRAVAENGTAYVVCNYDQGNIKRNRTTWSDENNMVSDETINKFCKKIVKCIDDF